MTVHPFIEAEKQSGHSIKRACELLKVSRAAFYARRTAKPGPRGRSRCRTDPADRLGPPALARHLRSPAHPRRSPAQGCRLRSPADRPAHAAGLQGIHGRRRHPTTIPDPRAAWRPDLVLRDSTPNSTAVDTPWCGDITYIPTEEGRLYLATIIDIASCRVVGWATAGHLRTDLVADALKTTCRQRRPTRPVIFHSDRGCQYTSQQFASLAAEFGVRRLSVGRTGQCWDNALAESFFATIKRELLGTQPGPSRALARTSIFDFIEGWYNLHRLHSSLGYRSPAEYEPALAA
ncbi:IS3 family transposase [Streptomyces sp. NPDC001700]